MKKKITVAVFVVIALAILGIYLGQKLFYHPEETKNSSTLVIPQVKSATDSVSLDSSVFVEEETLISLVPLESGETLLSIVSMDFDGDGYDDQINSIKTVNSPYISLLLGLYNPRKSTYERMSVIATEITQARTFTYTGMDLTGNHKISLIYQGFAQNGDSVLQAFFINRSGESFSLQKIADFRSDGTIFVQQIDRYDAYEKSHTKGESFPIWVYSSDSSRPNSVDQLQTRYDWNDGQNQYVQSSQVRVPGSRIAANELSKILDGSVQTFTKFLNGLWYKTINQGDEKLYLFFDDENQEVIFFNQSSEEVFNWIHSNIRKNGIYLSLVNQDLNNLQRTININLVSTDQIYVRNQDDLRMRITETNQWDGDYKKFVANLDNFSASKTSSSSSNDILVQDYISQFENAVSWKTSEGNLLSFSKGNLTFQDDSQIYQALYAPLQVGNQAFIQFRTKSSLEWLSQTYLLSYGTSLNSSEFNKNTIILQPYALQANGAYALNKRIIVLTRSDTFGE